MPFLKTFHAWKF